MQLDGALDQVNNPNRTNGNGQQPTTEDGHHAIAKQLPLVTTLLNQNTRLWGLDGAVVLHGAVHLTPDRRVVLWLALIANDLLLRRLG